MSTHPEQFSAKPVFSSFILSKLFSLLLSAISIPVVLLLFFSGLISDLQLNPAIVALGGLGLGALSFLFGLATAFIQYRKEHYEFSSGSLVKFSGGIFLDNKVELNIKNITHVDLELPFLEHLLFATGKISIRSAGTSAAEMVLTNLEKPEQVFDSLLKLMEQKGFNLEQDNLIYEDKPSNLGVVIELAQATLQLISLGFVFIFGLPVISSVAADLGIQIALIVAALAAFILVIYAIFFVLRFLDVKRRLYSVYETVIVYRKGFLTKHYAIIPLETMADSSTRQTFLQRLLGIYDILLSSKGLGEEIVFGNISNGPKMEDAIDQLIKNEYSQLRKKNVSEEEIVDKTPAGHAGNDDAKLSSQPKNEIGRNTAIDTSIFSDVEVLRMSWLRSLAPFVMSVVLLIVLIPLVLIFPPLLFFIFISFGAVFSIIGQIIRIAFTKYTLGPASVREEYKFLTTFNKEFTYSKITAVILKRDLFDKLLGTCSIRFLSIGSGTDVMLRHIKWDRDLVERVLSALAVNPMLEKSAEPMDTINSKFGLVGALSANSLGLIMLLIFGVSSLLISLSTGYKSMLGVFALISAIIFCGIIFISAYSYLYYKNSKLMLYSEFLHATNGLLVEQDYFVRYDNIRVVGTTKYPLLSMGNLDLNIAGELQALTEEQQKQMNQYGSSNRGAYSKIFDANRISMQYVEDVVNIGELMDQILLRQPLSGGYDREKIIEETTNQLKDGVSTVKPSWPVVFVNWLIPGLIIWPLLPFSVLAAITTLFISYEISSKRVLASSGIIFRRRLSVLHNRIDYMSNYQGLIQKVFKTGTININTTGSSTTEMQLNNIPDYEEVYKTLQSYYR